MDLCTSIVSSFSLSTTTFVEITPPEIKIISPKNTTYLTSTVPLIFTVNESTSWIGYTLDGQTNVTIFGNTTLTGLSEGSHNIVVYANDTSGNMGKSNTVSFTIHIPRPLTVTISPISSAILQGQSVTFTSTVNGGVTPYTYQWYLNGSAVTGATSSTWTFAPTSLQPIGKYIVYLIVTDSLAYSAQSNLATVTVAPPLTVTISPMSASMPVGPSLTFTSSVSGGYLPYSYQWYLNGNPVAGATSNIWAFTPTTGGIYYVYLKVADAYNNIGQSDTARVTVMSVPVGGSSVSVSFDRYPILKPLTFSFGIALGLAIVCFAVMRKTRKRRS